jgi:hypothetical protein
LAQSSHLLKLQVEHQREGRLHKQAVLRSTALSTVMRAPPCSADDSQSPAEHHLQICWHTF